MPEVFREIVDRRGKPGFIEKHVNIEVHVSDESVDDLDWDLVDDCFWDRLRKYANDKEYEAFSGFAKIAWKSDTARATCWKRIEQHPVPQRWERIEEFLEQMKQNEFPQFAHAYLHPSLTETSGLTVIDGTRRMLAYLELDRDEMPVVVFRAKAKG